MASGPQPSGHYMVAAASDTFYVRVVGLASMNNSARLQEVTEKLEGQGFRRLVFDLADCAGFDSTFMGILLGAALGSSRMAAEPSVPEPAAGSPVVLVNANREHRRLLAEVGVDRVVRLHPEPIDFPPVELRRLDDRPADPASRIQSIVAAHENLVRLGGRNAEKFGALLKELKRELGGDAPVRS